MGKRFLVNYDEDKQREGVFDCETDRFLDFYETISLLNKQDEEIKKSANALRGIIRNCGNASCELKNNKAIEVLEKVIDFIRNNETVPMYWDIAKFVNNQITELRGGENENLCQ